MVVIISPVEWKESIPSFQFSSLSLSLLHEAVKLPRRRRHVTEREKTEEETSFCNKCTFFFFLCDVLQTNWTIKDDERNCTPGTILHSLLFTGPVCLEWERRGRKERGRFLALKTKSLRGFGDWEREKRFFFLSGMFNRKKKEVTTSDEGFSLFAKGRYNRKDPKTFSSQTTSFLLAFLYYYRLFSAHCAAIQFCFDKAEGNFFAFFLCLALVAWNKWTRRIEGFFPPVWHTFPLVVVPCCFLLFIETFFCSIHFLTAKTKRKQDTHHTREKTPVFFAPLLFPPFVYRLLVPGTWGKTGGNQVCCKSDLQREKMSFAHCCRNRKGAFSSS